MAYLPDTLLLPPGPDDGEFWEHCDAGRLVFQGCAHCATVVHPPTPMCPGCQSTERAWVNAPREARVFTYTWAHSAAHESVKAVLPYNIVLVEFPALPGVRLVSNVVNVVPGELNFGDPLELAWEACANGRQLPRFRKIETPTGIGKGRTDIAQC
jgi:uncharacterized OB-fold protein